METLSSYAGDGEYLFACYSHADGDTVFEEITWLQARGVNIWFDSGIRAGVDWQERIAVAIHDSVGLIFFGSPNSIESKFCISEIYYAVSISKPCLAVYDESQRLPPGLELSLGSRQALYRNKLNRQDFLEKFYAGCQLLIVQRALKAESSASNTRQTVPQVAAQRSSGPQKKASKIIVLPTRTIGGDAETNQLAEMLTYDVANLLSRSSQFEVVSRVNLPHRSDLMNFARTEDANYVIECLLRQFGDDLHLSVSLVEVESGLSVWSESFETSVGQLMNPKGGAAFRISTSLSPSLWRIEGVRVSQKNLDELHGWELVHRADFVEFTAYREESARQAESLVRLALTRDADNPLAMASLARILSNKLLSDLVSSRQPVFDEMNAMVERAVQLAPMNPRVMINCATAKAAAGHLAESLSMARRSVEADPLIPAAKAFLGTVLIYTGSPQEGIDLIQSEIDLDPHNPRIFLYLGNMAMGYGCLGMYVKAVEALKEATLLHPTNPLLMTALAAMQAEVDPQAAAQTLSRARELNPRLTLSTFVKVHTQLVPQGDSRERRTILLEQTWDDAESLHSLNQL